jgi:hypothetical protein
LAIGTPTTLGTGLLTSSSTTTVTMTVAAGAAIGDLVLVAVTNDGGANLPSGVTDSVGNTYTALNAGQRSADDYSLRVFATVVTATIVNASTVITGTVDGGGGNWDKIIAALKITGSWNISTVLEQAAKEATGTSTSPDSGLTATTSVADAAIVGFMAAGGAPAASGGGPLTAATNSNTKLHNLNGGAFIDIGSVYQVVSATAQYRSSGTWQASDDWACVCFVLIEDAGSTPVSREVQLVYNLSAPVARETQLVYNLSAPVARETQLVYTVAGGVTTEVQLVYNLSAPVGQEWVLVYNLGDVVAVAVVEMVSRRRGVWQPDVLTIGRRSR